VPPVCNAQESFPIRPVRFVVPFPAATPPDILARIASQKLAESWGAPVIVEVRDGASGTIGVNQVVRAAPDGYTLLFTNDLSIAIAPVLSKTLYDPRKDLAPIAAVAQGVSVLVMHPSAGVSSIKELIAVAKARPGALTFASAGDASTSRMRIELIKRAAGIELVQVPYRGAACDSSGTYRGGFDVLFPRLPGVTSPQIGEAKGARRDRLGTLSGHS